MTVAKAARFRSFEAYLAADPADLPEGRCEYWDGALVPVMAESGLNDALAKYLMFAFMGLNLTAAQVLRAEQ
jgi:hypothetical protein